MQKAKKIFVFLLINFLTIPLVITKNRCSFSLKKRGMSFSKLQSKQPCIDLNKAFFDLTLYAQIKPYVASRSIINIPLTSLYQQNQNEQKFVFIIPSYNNALWYEKNLESIFKQKYTNYHIIYIDDASSDNTASLVEEYVKKHNMEQKITIIKNKQRKYMAYNRYMAVHLCADTDICLALDGDDWIPHENLLSFYNIVYKDKNVWLTYGSYECYPSGKKGICREIDEDVLSLGSVRKAKWTASHFKTHYAWLFKQIDKRSFIHNGEFITRVTDLAMMFPMLEMAGHYSKFIPSITYIYNATNTLTSLERVKMEKTSKANSILLRRSKSYDPIVIESI